MFDYSKLPKKKLLETYSYWDYKIRKTEYDHGGKYSRFSDTVQKKNALKKEIEKRNLKLPESKPVFRFS